MQALKAKPVRCKNGDWIYRGLRIQKWYENGYMGPRAYYISKRIPGAKATNHKELCRLIDWIARQQDKPTLKIEK